ncbi:MAG: ABC transporter permease [Gemmobacter sp.]
MRPKTFARPGGEGIILAALLLFGIMLFVLPMALLFAQGLAPGGRPGLAPLAEALASRAVRRALVNSLDSAAMSSLLALVAGTGLALLIGLTDLRGRAVLVFLILLPMMIPPHVTAIAWTQTLGPSSALLGALGLAPSPGTSNPLYSRGGVIALLAVQSTPLVFLVMLAACRTLPRDGVEAARVSGAGPGLALRRVVLPLLGPAMVAAGMLAFVSALGNFGIPALLGIPGRYTTLPVLIYQRLSAFGPGMLPGVAVLSVLMAVVAATALVAQRVLARRAAVRLTGGAQGALRLRLGRARPLVEGALWALVAGVVLVPLAALVATALVPVYGVPLNAGTLTLDNFREVLGRQPATRRAFGNSALAAGVAGVVLAAVAVLAARFSVARGPVSRRLGAGFTGAADLAYAVPGIVISIAFILTFLRPLPLLDISIYGTLGIIILAYLAAFAAIALKPVAAAQSQLDPALDEAARVCGAGLGRRIARIQAPLLAPAAASGAILVFLTAYNEITVSALLWSRGNETIGALIFNYDQSGAGTIAAAMAVVTVAVTAAVLFGLDRAGRHLPPGVVPWR